MAFSLKSIVNVALLLLVNIAVGQDVSRVGFYNVQNLFDTINDPAVDDGKFCDTKKYNYSKKLESVSRAISLFKPDILGLSEVENYGVVEELRRSTNTNYAIIHYDSRDSRGIDVAALYDTTKFTLISSEPISVDYLWREPMRAEFLSKVSGQRFVIYLAHLPSKIGGKAAEVKRKDALKLLDSMAVAESSQRVIILGDMNDNPTPSKVLDNLAEKGYKNGSSSYVYRDRWTTPDQIIITPELKRYLKNDFTVVTDQSLITQSGRFKGYPKRNDPSDHLPVYIDIRL